MIEIGITGRPNCGKSSFLKAATLADVKISSVPFTTLKPNIALGYVTFPCVCKEFNVKCKPKTGSCINGVRFVPIQLWDLPGIVPEAHLGRGLGLQFLDEIRRASVLIHIVDFSGLTDGEGKPTTNYNPENDIKFVEKEIDLWFANLIKKAIQKFEKKVATASKANLVKILSEQLSGLEISKDKIELALEKASITDVENFAKILRKISKPILLAANKIDLKEAQENYEKLKEKYEYIIPTSAEAEIALKKAAEKGLIDYLPGDDFEVKGELTKEQEKALEFIKNQIIRKYGSTGVQDCLNKAVFDLLKYIAVFPVADVNKLSDKEGRVLPDVFLVPPKTTVRELAYKIHTEIGEKFICGIDARTKQKLSADHQLKHRDVVEIVFRK